MVNVISQFSLLSRIQLAPVFNREIKGGLVNQSVTFHILYMETPRNSLGIFYPSSFCGFKYVKWFDTRQLLRSDCLRRLSVLNIGGRSCLQVYVLTLGMLNPSHTRS